PDEERAAPEVEGAGGAGLVHREGRGAVAGDPGAVAEGLGDRLPEADPEVLGRVMAVDLDVAGGPHLQVEEAVPADLVEHVPEEGEGDRDVGRPAYVEVDRDLDLRLLGLSRDGGGAAHRYLRGYHAPEPPRQFPPAHVPCGHECLG